MAKEGFTADPKVREEDPSEPMDIYNSRVNMAEITNLINKDLRSLTLLSRPRPCAFPVPYNLIFLQLS